MKFYIYDVEKPETPFIFEDNGTQEPAIFADEAKARFMCHMMNSVNNANKYGVAVM